MYRAGFNSLLYNTEEMGSIEEICAEKSIPLFLLCELTVSMIV